MGIILHKVLLYCLYKIEGERSIYSIYHLLNGKKSSQTIQDAHLFQLSPFFNTYRQVTRNDLDEFIKESVQDQLLIKSNEHHYILSEKGMELIRNLFTQYPFLEHLNGWQYQGSERFWERLSLFVQVASNLAHSETNYFPIQRNKQVQLWMKNFLVHTDINRKELSQRLYDELVFCFNKKNAIDPSVLVVRLTGYNTIGRTKEQACEVLDMEYSLYHFQLLSLLHDMQKCIHGNKTKLPILSSMVEDLQDDVPLTHSTKRTYELISRGYTVEQIAIMRRLKKNTIEDHIVELALNIKEFDIEPYVDGNKQEKILEAAKKVPSKQLRYIREYVKEADYFEIRLVIAKSGDGK
ncbi:helix-turn-helix domain-containing protein [Cytobacillus sp. FJAT-54145]|uniref:Helix-turn-helix domain-containing protein n=1 Tax=Cytobacillus spartinae TaxID=3299023 RepID=A0ABW6KGD2_9BACI